jgi:hypothetical protein
MLSPSYFPSLGSTSELGQSLWPVRNFLSWGGKKVMNPSIPIFFWVDQKQSSYKVGKRKLEIQLQIWINSP